jgi:hypothetical protein
MTELDKFLAARPGLEFELERHRQNAPEPDPESVRELLETTRVAREELMRLGNAKYGGVRAR